MAKENLYGVKVGDIFYMDDNSFIHFYQVVELKGTTQVVIREVDRKVIEQENHGVIVVPDENNFLEDLGGYIKDNRIGATKTIKKEKHWDNEELTITFSKFYDSDFDKAHDSTFTYSKDAYLWDGNPKKHEVIYY